MITAQTELLLTSAGLTTDAIQQRALEIAQNQGNPKKLNIVRVSDGWLPFTSQDRVSVSHRAEQRTASVTSRLWSSRYVAHVLGSAKLLTQRFQGLDESHVESLLSHADILLVPGGNTYQTMKGLKPHAELIKQVIMTGLPYIAESAGSIIAGNTIMTAGLDPADTRPRDVKADSSALRLVDAEIIVHASGNGKDFQIPGIQSWLARRVLASYTTSSDAIQSFASESRDSVHILTDVQALYVSNGGISLLS